MVQDTKKVHLKFNKGRQLLLTITGMVLISVKSSVKNKTLKHILAKNQHKLKDLT